VILGSWMVSLTAKAGHGEAMDVSWLLLNGGHGLAKTRWKL